MAAKKKNTKKVIKVPVQDATRGKLVHIQAHEALVVGLKIAATKNNQKMYEAVNQALTEWLQNNSAELESIAALFTDFQGQPSPKHAKE